MQPEEIQKTLELSLWLNALGWTLAAILAVVWRRTEKALFKAYDALNRAEYSAVHMSNAAALQKSIETQTKVIIGAIIKSAEMEAPLKGDGSEFIGNSK